MITRYRLNSYINLLEFKLCQLCSLPSSQTSVDEVQVKVVCQLKDVQYKGLPTAASAAASRG